MTWKDFDILTQRRSSMPHVIRNENPAYYDPESTGTPVWVFAPICLDSSHRLLKLERISIFTSIPRNELRKLQWNPPSHDSSGLDWIGATVGRYFLHHMVNAVNWKPGKSGPQES